MKRPATDDGGRGRDIKQPLGRAAGGYLHLFGLGAVMRQSCDGMLPDFPGGISCPRLRTGRIRKPPYKETACMQATIDRRPVVPHTGKGTFKDHCLRASDGDSAAMQAMADQGMLASSDWEIKDDHRRDQLRNAAYESIGQEQARQRDAMVGLPRMIMRPAQNDEARATAHGQRRFRYKRIEGVKRTGLVGPRFPDIVIRDIPQYGGRHEIGGCG